MTYIDRFFEEKIFLKIENTTELNIINHHAEQRGIKPLFFLFNGMPQPLYIVYNWDGRKSIGYSMMTEGGVIEMCARYDYIKLDFDELCYNIQIKKDDLFELLGG